VINSFALWANNMPLSVAIQLTPWAIPALQTIHILGVAFVLTASLMINLRVLGVAARRQSLPDMMQRYTPWIWHGTAVLVVSGVVLALAQALDVIPNILFQIKMVLLAGVLITTFLAGQTPSGASRALVLEQGGGATGRTVITGGARALSALSILLWVAIVVAGRWIAYI
jgi:hypothetical protein